MFTEYCIFDALIKDVKSFFLVITFLSQSDDDLLLPQKRRRK